MIESRILLAVCCILACLTLPVLGQSQAVNTVNVRDFGAKGDGVADDTPAFEGAFRAVGSNGGTVSVPIGNYLIKSHIRVPNNTTLEGVWRIPTAFTQNQGSTLLAVEGEGSETGPAFITLGINSTVKGITVFYPNQNPDDIKPYPWCIACAGGDNPSIIDCLLVNPYQGVDFGTNPSGRHYIRNLYGQPLRRGIFVDKCYDVGRIENVHFWPFWKWGDNQHIKEWLTRNGEAFIFARTDWEYVFNTFCFGYGIGYRFIKSKDGPMNGNLLGIGADACNIAMLVEETQPPGLLITNGEFVSFLGDKPTYVVVKSSHTGVVQFQNSAFWGGVVNVARIAGTGTVSFNNCNFVQWDARSPAIETFGGNLLVNGCNFMGTGPQVALRGSTESAVVTANRFAGPKGITNPAKADLQEGLNVFRKPPAKPVEEAGAIVVDDADDPLSVAFVGEWHLAENTPGLRIGYYLGTHWAMKGSGETGAAFRPKVRKAGLYDVYAFFGPDPSNDHASSAEVIVHSTSGASTLRVDMRQSEGKWVKLGTFRFKAGQSGTITFTNNADGNVLADAVKLVPVE